MCAIRNDTGSTMETSSIQPTSVSDKMHCLELRTRKKRHTFKTCDKIIALSKLNEFVTLSNGKKIVRFKACTEWLNKNLPGTFAKVTAKHLFNWHHAIRQQSDQPSQQASQQPGQPSQSYTAQQSDQLSQQASQQPGQPSQSSDQLMSPTKSFIKSRGRKRTLMEVEMEQLKQALVPIMNSGMPMTIGMIRSVLANAMGERLDYVVDFNSFKLSESTVRRWIKEWGLSMRMATTSWQDPPTNWELQRDEAVMRLAIVVKLYDIPPELVINYDQTAQHLVPTAKRCKTLVPTGTRHVAVLGLGDKRQYTLRRFFTSNRNPDRSGLRLLVKKRL